jgi:hypothetical protein
MDLEQYEAEVSTLRANTVSSSSRAVYTSSTVKMLQWMYHNKRHLVSDMWLSNVALDDHGNILRSSIISMLQCAPNNPPIHFEELAAQDFMVWIVTLKKGDGSPLGYSTFNTHRAALFNLYRDFGAQMSKPLETELKNHFKGLKRQTALNIAAGEGEIKIGKDPLSFSLYCFLGRQLLLQPQREYIFARCFLVLCWNLMSRAGNTFGIMHQHMEWSEDALCIYFSHMKNDQTGERPRDPRHVYANPKMPEICPITCLGMYWLCFEFDDTNHQLFPGTRQYDRFRKLLARCVRIDTVAAELERRAVQQEKLVRTL